MSHHAVRYLRGADYVYHLAEVGPSASPHLAAFHDNVLINSNTLKACRVNGISNFVYVSSTCSPAQHAVRGNQGAAAGGDAVTVAYLHSKIAGEYEAELVKSSAVGFNLGIVRLHQVYGPSSTLANDSSFFVMPSLLHQA